MNVRQYLYLHVVQGLKNQLLENNFLIFQCMFWDVVCIELIELTLEHHTI